MTKSEWDELVRSLTGGELNLGKPVLDWPVTQQLAGAVESRGSTDRSTMAASTGDRATPAPQSAVSAVEDLVRAIAVETPSRVATSVAMPVAKTVQNDDGLAESALKTAGKYMGISPVITGLFRLFGGGGDDEQETVMSTPFAMPRALSLDAGVTADRSITSVSYAQQGGIRPVQGEMHQGASRPVQTNAQQAPVQITVQAIDSRSFMDHRDEIARAVREAMLNSHSLNDVVSEL